MRKQLNELVSLTEELRDAVVYHKINIGSGLDVSENIKLYKITDIDFYNVSFIKHPTKLEVSLYNASNYRRNSIDIDIDRLTEIELDVAMLRIREEIAIFIAGLAESSVKQRLEKIQELQNQLSELQGNVPTN
jgi:hypothetical protein